MSTRIFPKSNAVEPSPRLAVREFPLRRGHGDAAGFPALDDRFRLAS